LDPSYTGKLLEAAKAMMKIEAGLPVKTAPGATNVAANQTAWYQNFNDASSQNELFRRVGRSQQTGKNVEKLFRRNVGIRYFIDNLGCKLPASWGSDGPTPVHQDAAHFPIDRTGTMTCWIALDRIIPDQGSMRFFEGSHGGDVFGDPSYWRSQEEILEIYPWIRDYPLSAPLTYAPGDATIHHSKTVHCAPANTTNIPRWSYAVAYLAADARYNGAFCAETNGRNLEINQPITHEAFELIWGGSNSSR
jgi:hypothetical protein